jgi:hypothetical protein
VDIAWVWHLHKLNPEVYKKDCMLAFNKVIETPEPFAYLHPGKKKAEEDRDPIRENTDTSLPCAKISFDIFECAERQSVFLWNVR